MVSPSAWIRYATSKLLYTAAVSLEKYNAGQINRAEFNSYIVKHFFQEKLTVMKWMANPGGVMAPTIHADGAAVLIRMLPYSRTLYALGPVQRRIFVGDVVIMRDPQKPSQLIMRRLAAVEGDEMVSSDEKDEPFVIEKNQCWVLADNKSLKPKEVRDSRLFGPVHMSNICGRVIYSLRTVVDHGPVENSRMAMEIDSAVLAAELNVEALANGTKSRPEEKAEQNRLER